MMMMMIMMMMMMMMVSNCFCGMIDPQKVLALFPVGTIVRDPHYREFPTRCKQDLNLCTTCFQASLLLPAFNLRILSGFSIPSSFL